MSHLARNRRSGIETYYDPADLAKFGDIGKDAPELAKKYFDYYAEVFKEGELTAKEKALIALGVPHAVQCPYCIDAYTRACLELGGLVQRVGHVRERSPRAVPEVAARRMCRLTRDTGLTRRSIASRVLTSKP